jgi:protocatechuate 3,4-dioxygenase beta subunit
VAPPPTSTGDLTAVEGGTARAQGQIIEVTGRILNRAGDAVRGARLVVWQANCFGRYVHPNDCSQAPTDPNFIGFVEILTNDAGFYRLKTVKPGAYAAAPDRMRPPHIHFEIYGKFERLITQMYFPGEPLNAGDRLLMSAQRPDLLIARAVAPEPTLAHPTFQFEIVLTRG